MDNQRTIISCYGDVPKSDLKYEPQRTQRAQRVMDTNTLMFDDWAMYLVKHWLRPEPDQAYGRGGEREERFNELLTHLCHTLQYPVSPHRYGYANYLTITLDAFHHAAILRISCYVAVHQEIPHSRGGGMPFFNKFHNEYVHLEGLILDTFFAEKF